MKSIFLALSVFLFTPFYHSFQTKKVEKTTKVAEISAKPNVTVISIGTLSSALSPVGQMMQVWAKAVNEKSGGLLELKLFYKGMQGDEGTMVGKMKSGQLQGAALSQVGLAKIYKPIGAMGMLGLFKDWNTASKALDIMKPEFERGISDANFSIGTWYYNGAIRFMSKGTSLKLPTDFKTLKAYSWKDDANVSPFYTAIGGVSVTPLNVSDVFPNLNTGAINALYGSSLFAEQAQWDSKLDNICEEVDAISVGGIVFSSKVLDGLSPDLRDILLVNAKMLGPSISSKYTTEDAAAFKRLKGKMKLVSRSAEEKDAWNAVFLQTRQKLSQTTYSADLVTKLEGLAK